jgi:hypothetical protein
MEEVCGIFYLLATMSTTPSTLGWGYEGIRLGVLGEWTGHGQLLVPYYEELRVDL